MAHERQTDRYLSLSAATERKMRRIIAAAMVAFMAAGPSSEAVVKVALKVSK